MNDAVDQLLRRAGAEWRADQPPPLEPDLARITRVATPPSKRRRARRRLAIVAGLAAAITAGAVSLNAVTYHHKPVSGASAEAAALLNEAADNAQRAADPAPKPGEYLYARTHAWYGFGGGVPNGSSKASAYCLSEQLIEEWFAHDGTEDIRTTAPVSVHCFNAADERQLRASVPDQFVKKVNWQRGLSADPTPWELTNLPSDPDKLLRNIDADYGHYESREKQGEYEFFRITELLKSGLLRGSSRATVFRALTRIPGVYLVSKTANLDGRRGVAVGRIESYRDVRREIYFDVMGGAYIGEREVMVHTHQPNGYVYRAPDGTVNESTAVTMKIVSGKP